MTPSTVEREAGTQPARQKRHTTSMVYHKYVYVYQYTISPGRYINGFIINEFPIRNDLYIHMWRISYVFHVLHIYIYIYICEYMYINIYIHTYTL